MNFWIFEYNFDALDPKTAFEFNKFLVEKSEEFVNKLNQNIYLEQIDFVEKQVNKNRKGFYLT